MPAGNAQLNSPVGTVWLKNGLSANHWNGGTDSKPHCLGPGKEIRAALNRVAKGVIIIFAISSFAALVLLFSAMLVFLIEDLAGHPAGTIVAHLRA